MCHVRGESDDKAQMPEIFTRLHTGVGIVSGPGGSATGAGMGHWHAEGGGDQSSGSGHPLA